MKQKNVLIYPGVDRSVFLTCLEIVCGWGYDQLAHQKQMVSFGENLSENEVKESGSFLTDKASVNFSQVSFPLRLSLWSYEFVGLQQLFIGLVFPLL